MSFSRIYFFSLLVLPVLLPAQRRYFDRTGKQVDSTEAYYHYTDQQQTDNGWWYVKEFAYGDTLVSEGAFSNYNAELQQPEGLHRHYYSSGKIWYTEEFAKGIPTGERKTYYRSGALKRVEPAENGHWAAGKCYLEDGSEKAFTPFQQVPMYPGGEDSLLTYLNNNVKYPVKARENGIKGKVLVSFVVNRDGKVTDVRIIRDIGGGCGAEVFRVISAMPDWTPGYQDDVPVKVRYSLPVAFSEPGDSPTEKKRRKKH